MYLKNQSNEDHWQFYPDLKIYLDLVQILHVLKKDNCKLVVQG